MIPKSVFLWDLAVVYRAIRTSNAVKDLNMPEAEGRIVLFAGNGIISEDNVRIVPEIVAPDISEVTRTSPEEDRCARPGSLDPVNQVEEPEIVHIRRGCATRVQPVQVLAGRISAAEFKSQ